MLKQFKIITLAPTCFGSPRNHHLGAVLCLAKTTDMVFLCSSVNSSHCYGGISACCADVNCFNISMNFIIVRISWNNKKCFYTIDVRCKHEECIRIFVTCVLHTGCPRRNVKYFGRVFLMLNYADITQNTYIQS